MWQGAQEYGNETLSCSSQELYDKWFKRAHLESAHHTIQSKEEVKTKLKQI